MFPVIRFPQSIAMLLMVALFASAGCQCLSSKFATPKPQVVSEMPASIPTPINDGQDPYFAFRPIMPEQIMQPTPAPIPEHISEPPKIEWQPDTTSQSIIEELNRKIAELEAQVAEARQQSPIVAESPEPDVFPAKEESAKVQRLPVINKQGVTVYFDELQRVRFEVMDKVLFTPNSWQLTAEGEETLRTIAAEIRAFDPKADVDFEGHTDSLMGDPKNQMQKHDISSVKAKAAMDFFVNTLRWDAAKIGTSSFGRSRPVADNGTPEGRARNNRIEIVLRSQSE